MGNGAPPRRNVAIFFDVENLFGGYRRDVTGVQLGKVVRTIEQIVRTSGIGGKTAMVRAYANWARPEMVGYKRELQEYGIKPVQVFSFEKSVKNAADIELCVEALEVAHDAPWVEVFVIVTGDGGFVPLVRRLHFLNKYVVVVSTTAPNSGIVNPLLKSVADEYHQIDVQGPAGPAGPAGSADVTQPSGPPDVAVLKEAILGFIEKQPQLSKKGQINTQALGQLVSKKWPGLKYTSYKSTNLGGFLEKHCGLAIQRPAPQKAITAQKAPGKHVKLPEVPVKVPPKPVKPPAALTVNNRDEYIASVRELFTDGELGQLVRAQRIDGLHLGQVSAHLREAISGYTSADSGFPKFHMALQEALGGTDFRVVRTGEKLMAVVHFHHADPAHVLAEQAPSGIE